MTINDLCFSFYRGFHNSLIVNELFFQKIWPVREIFVSLQGKVSNIGDIYKILLI